MIIIIKAEERKTLEEKVIIIKKILVQCLLPDHALDTQNILPPVIPRKTLKEKNQNTIHNKISQKIILKVSGHQQMRWTNNKNNFTQETINPKFTKNKIMFRVVLQIFIIILPHR